MAERNDEARLIHGRTWYKNRVSAVHLSPLSFMYSTLKGKVRGELIDLFTRLGLTFCLHAPRTRKKQPSVNNAMKIIDVTLF